jgi:hypothetical protein
MKADDVKRLKELELENARLKRIVADQALNIDALKEVAKGRMFLLRMKIKGSWTNSLRFGIVVGGAGDRELKRRFWGWCLPRCLVV